ncbi:hypothetical protein GCM10020331_070260 [Ectobacillus funiculus]
MYKMRLSGYTELLRILQGRKEKEEELRQTKELLESLFHHSADPILLLSLDSVVQDINEAAKKCIWLGDS